MATKTKPTIYICKAKGPRKEDGRADMRTTSARNVAEFLAIHERRPGWIVTCETKSPK